VKTSAERFHGAIKKRHLCLSSVRASRSTPSASGISALPRRRRVVGGRHSEADRQAPRRRPRGGPVGARRSVSSQEPPPPIPAAATHRPRPAAAGTWRRQGRRGGPARGRAGTRPPVVAHPCAVHPPPRLAARPVSLPVCLLAPPSVGRPRPPGCGRLRCVHVPPPHPATRWGPFPPPRRRCRPATRCCPPLCWGPCPPTVPYARPTICLDDGLPLDTNTPVGQYGQCARRSCRAAYDTRSVVRDGVVCPRCVSLDGTVVAAEADVVGVVPPPHRRPHALPPRPPPGARRRRGRPVVPPAQRCWEVLQPPPLRPDGADRKSGWPTVFFPRGRRDSCCGRLDGRATARLPRGFQNSQTRPRPLPVPYGQLTKKKSAPPTRLGDSLPRFSNLQTTAARSPRRRGAPTRRRAAARRARRHRHRRASWVPRRPPPRRRGRLRRRTRARAAAAAPAAHARRDGS